MKVGALIKRNKLLILVALAYLAIFIMSPNKAIMSVENSVYYLIEMFQVLPVIFLLTVVIEALVPKDLIIRGFGEESGLKGNFFALLFGSLSAGPIYAAFPISKTLLGKGASVSNIVIILSAWAVIKVPMLANEAKFLGANFMAVRWVLTVIAIFIMAYLTGLFVKKEDMRSAESGQETRELEINEGYCIGCGLCVKLLPEYYEMKEQKAVVKKMPEGKKAKQAVRESAERCPAKAIIFDMEEKAS